MSRANGRLSGYVYVIEKYGYVEMFCYSLSDAKEAMRLNNGKGRGWRIVRYKKAAPTGGEQT